MRKSEVVVGYTYTVKVSGQLVPVKITRESLYGGWDGVNTVTGRSVRIKNASRLRKPVNPSGRTDAQILAADMAHVRHLQREAEAFGS